MRRRWIMCNDWLLKSLRRVRLNLNTEIPVLAADTAVYWGGMIMGKPKNQGRLSGYVDAVIR